MANILSKVKEFFSKIGAFCVKIWDKAVALFREKTKNVKWKEVWDKCTTALLILIFASPLIVLGYIFLWFLMR